MLFYAPYPIPMRICWNFHSSPSILIPFHSIAFTASIQVSDGKGNGSFVNNTCSTARWIHHSPHQGLRGDSLQSVGSFIEVRTHYESFYGQKCGYLRKLISEKWPYYPLQVSMRATTGIFDVSFLSIFFVFGYRNSHNAYVFNERSLIVHSRVRWTAKFCLETQRGVTAWTEVSPRTHVSWCGRCY